MDVHERNVTTGVLGESPRSVQNEADVPVAIFHAASYEFFAVSYGPFIVGWQADRYRSQVSGEEKRPLAMGGLRAIEPDTTALLDRMQESLTQLG